MVTFMLGMLAGIVCVVALFALVLWCGMALE
jgi:hypothetical protein